MVSSVKNPLLLATRAFVENPTRSDSDMTARSNLPATREDDQPPKSGVDSTDREKMMTIVEHLDELRVRLVRSLIYVAVGVVIGLIFCKRILRLLEAPAGGISFQALSLEEPIVVFFKVAFYV